jgi:Ca2+/Na+ antiporter
MIGFGISFLIAKIQGKHVSVKMDNVLKTMLIALTLSLLASTAILATQRFQTRRFHSFILIALYAAFIVVIILEESHVLF